MSNARHFREQAARAIRLAHETLDSLTQQRLKGLAVEYLTRATELERGGLTAPPDSNPAE
jgi:hypothetical protein